LVRFAKLRLSFTFVSTNCYSGALQETEEVTT
jgi:hypothetical protein